MEELKKNKIYYGINFIIKQNDDSIIEKIKKIIKQNDSMKLIEIKYYTNKNNIIDTELTIYVETEEETYIYYCNNNIYKDLNSIFNEFNIVPKLFVSNFDTNMYRNNLVKIEHQRDILKNKLFKKYDTIFKKNFKVINGLNDIFEWYTGAVYFKNYEWEEIQDNSLKTLFQTYEKSSFIYSLPLDDGIILRSANIYYYFSTDVSRFEKPTLEQIKKWFDNCDIFYDNCLDALSNYKIRNNYDIRLLLGVIDNLRNIILLLLNCELLFNDQNDFIYSLNYNKPDINKYIENVKEYQELYRNLCLNRPVNINVISKIINLIKQLKKSSNNTKNNICKINNSYILSKCFNPLREIDNYFENYIICEYSINEILKKNNYSEINIVGVLYGGLELPLIISNNEIFRKKINISLVFQNHGMYLDRQVKDKSIITNELKKYGLLNETIPTIIIDDNMMSGVTMQLIYNQLKIQNKLNIKNIVVIRHPNINRLPQLKHFNMAMNLKMIDKMIFGLISDTPYTKIKENTNYNNMFVNELNIFSIMTEVFLKALYINNSFIKDSQVDIFKGYSEGKNDKI